MFKKTLIYVWMTLQLYEAYLLSVHGLPRCAGLSGQADVHLKPGVPLFRQGAPTARMRGASPHSFASTAS